jgi:hypothetical protein
MYSVTDNLFEADGGDSFDLSALDAEEKELVRDLVSFANEHSDGRPWMFRNYYIGRVGEFYEGRGLSRKEVTQTTVWKLAQSIAGRLMVAAGIARDPKDERESDDYREKLDSIIREKYGSRRKFCELTGISEDMLSHVLAKRKHLSIQALSDALAKIGYGIQITPMPDVSPPST